MCKNCLFFAGLGWMIGTAAMWAWFHCNNLIRSRSEWYALRKAQGKKVPDDWEYDDV